MKLNLLIYTISVVFLFLSSCSNIPTTVVTPTVPLYQIQADTWNSIDERILHASISARKKSQAYALLAMNNWRRKIREHIEDIFIPWYSSYWTQQLLATRVAWYKIQYSEGEITPEERLTQYLQQEFYEQVLEPVNQYIEPHSIMKEATVIYLLKIKSCVDQLSDEHQIPVSELNKHLKFIPAIAINMKSFQDASLYDVLQINSLDDLPAYKKLLAQINEVNGSINSKTSNGRLYRVAQRAVTKLVAEIEIRGSASVASLVVGGHWGLLISAGSSTWSVTEYGKDKEHIENQLRANLEVMLDMMWQALVKDDRGSVTAVVHHMSKQIENSLLTIGPSGSGIF